MPTPNAFITKLYIGYFNRAPDPEGLTYWTRLLNSGTSELSIASSFAQAPEAIAIYNYLAASGAVTADEFLTSVYSNLFNRAPDAAGLSYWKGELASGKPAGRMIIDLINGAQGADKTVIDNKAAAARNYVEHLGGASGESFHISDARRVIGEVNSNSGSVSRAIEALERPDAGNGLTLSFVDPSGAHAQYEAGIRDSVTAAWDMWADHFTKMAPIEIEIAFQPGAPGVLAFAGSTVEVYTGQTYNGLRVTQSGAGYELATGRDPNGAAADGRITITADLARLVFRDSPDDPLPAGKFDALSIFAHEFGHVLGFRSTLDEDGHTQQTRFLTTYDRYVSGFFAGSLNFRGEQAMAVKGGAVPLADSGPAHLGIGSDLMSSSLRPGQAKLVGVLDVAVLQDLGLPVSLALFEAIA